MAVDYGETLVIETTVRDADTDALVNPTSIVITITRGTITLVNGVAMSKDSVGQYHYDYTNTNLGIHTISVKALRGDRITITKDSFKVV